MQLIESYQVSLAARPEALSQHAGHIACFSGGQLALICRFVRGAIPANTVSAGIHYFYYPESMFPIVLDVLRNESPVYFSWNATNCLGSITTSSEPVGEEET